MKRITYKDKQRFDRYEVLVLLIVLSLALINLMVAEFLNPQPDTILRQVIMSSLLAVIATSAFRLYTAKLKVSVNEKRIKYKLSSRTDDSGKIPLKEIVSVEPIRTPGDMTRFENPLFSLFKKERFVSVTGRNGVSVRTKSGESYFIGSRKPLELFDAIHSMLSQKQIAQ